MATMTAPATMAAPSMQPLVEKYRPMTMDAFAGLGKPRAILGHLAANPYPSAWLLLGPSGLGKTTMALALAKSIGGEVHHIPSRNCDLDTVERVCAGCHYAPMFGETWHIVLVDEADQMSKPAQLAFLSKLDTTAAPPNTIFIFTANSTAALADRFLSRVRTVRFTTDGLADPAAGLLAGIWRNEAPAGAAAPDFAQLVADAGNNIRQAIMDLEMELIAARVAAAARPPQLYVLRTGAAIIADAGASAGPWRYVTASGSRYTRQECEVR
jgi:replication-associated recombination protein RarA